MNIPALLLAAACLAVPSLAALPAMASEERGSFLGERSGYDEMLRFRSENGGSFRPRAVIVLGTGAGAGGALTARLPEAATVQDENRVDLSGTPGLGPLFRGTLDVASAREGELVGPIYRVGDTLVIDAGAAPAGLTNRRVALATNVPRYGAISFQLGVLNWQPSAARAVGGAPIGSAHLVGETLVLASQGGEPAWPSLEAMFEDLF